MDDLTQDAKDHDAEKRFARNKTTERENTLKLNDEHLCDCSLWYATKQNRQQDFAGTPVVARTTNSVSTRVPTTPRAALNIRNEDAAYDIVDVYKIGYRDQKNDGDCGQRLPNVPS